MTFRTTVYHRLYTVPPMVPSAIRSRTGVPEGRGIWVTTSGLAMTVPAAGVKVTLTNPPDGAPTLVTVNRVPGLAVSVNPFPAVISADCAVVTVK